LVTVDDTPRVEHADCSDAESVAIFLYAGPAAATRGGGPARLLGSADMEMLAQCAAKLPSDVAEMIPSMARNLVNEHWAAIEEMARVILLHGTLQGDDLARELARIMTEHGTNTTT
jgi:hypothetical protein